MARYKVGLETQGKILEATRRLLGESGFEAITVKGICAAAGIQAGSFYNLFPTKDEAVLTVVRDAISTFDPDPDGEGNDTVEALVDAYTGFVIKDPELGRVYAHMAVTAALTQDHLAGRIQRHHEQRVERFTNAYVREHPDVSRSLAGYRMEILLGALNGLSIRWSIDPTFDICSYASLMVDELSTTP